MQNERTNQHGPLRAGSGEAAVSTPLIQGEPRAKLETIAKELNGPPFRSMCEHTDLEMIYELQSRLVDVVKALLEAKES